MTLNRGLLFWGLALITAGAVALATQQGYFDRDALAGAWRLWPLILIAIGVSVVLSRTPFAILGTIVAALVVGTAGGALIAVGPGSFNCGGAEPTNLTTRQGTFGDAARVQLDLNCGTLRVGMENPRLATGENVWTVTSGQGRGSAAEISADSDRLEVRSPNNDNWLDGDRQRWAVSLPWRPSYQLEMTPNAADTTINLGGGRFTLVSVHPNAGSLTLDLTDAEVDNLDLSLNAGSASVIIGRAPLSAGISVNAGSIDLCVEDGVALQVTTNSNITFSHNLDESDLVQVGDSWSTPGYADAADQVTIDVEGNAASFTLNPEGGCE